MRLARFGSWVGCVLALTACGWSVPPRTANLALPPRAGTATASPVAGFVLANAALTIGFATECGGSPIDLVNRADEHALAGLRAEDPVEHLVVSHPRTREQRLWIGGADEKLPLAWSMGYALEAGDALLAAEVKVSNLSSTPQRVPNDFLNRLPGTFTSALPLVESAPKNAVTHPAFVVYGWDQTLPTNLVLSAGVTRTFTRWWYPVLGLGGLKTATRFAAINFFATGTPGEIFLGIHAPARLSGCTVEVKARGQILLSVEQVSISPSKLWCRTFKLPENVSERDVQVTLRAADGNVLAACPARKSGNEPGRESENVLALLDKAFRLRQRGEAAPASKTLRAVTAIAPLDPVAAVERIFLEDDGEGAVETLVRERGLTKASYLWVKDFYRKHNAERELSEWTRQGRAAGLE